MSTCMSVMVSTVAWEFSRHMRIVECRCTGHRGWGGVRSVVGRSFGRLVCPSVYLSVCVLLCARAVVYAVRVLLHMMLRERAVVRVC